MEFRRALSACGAVSVAFISRHGESGTHTDLSSLTGRSRAMQALSTFRVGSAA